MVLSKETSLFQKDAVQNQFDGINQDLLGKASNMDAVLKTQVIFYRSATVSNGIPVVPAAPTTWVSRSDDVSDQWSTRHLKISPSETASQNYIYIWTCTQKQPITGNPTCTQVSLDESITVIQGGSIVTGSITSNQIASRAITADKIAVGAITIGTVSNLQSTLDGKASTSSIPTNVSQLNNDSSYATTTAVSNAQTAAQKVATNYITEIDAHGITIKARSGNTSSGDDANYIKLDGTGMEVFRHADSVAKFGTSVTLGSRASGSTIGSGSASIGTGLTSSGSYSFAEGYDGTASGDYSHAEGHTTVAGAHYSHAEGRRTSVSGNYGHAEGNETQVTAQAGHAEGYKSKAQNTYAHAEGNETEANGYASHAEGRKTIAQGHYTHSEGNETQATSIYAHAQGNGCVASGSSSHAGGDHTIAQGFNQTVIGQYNIAQGTNNSNQESDQAFIIGNGVSGNRANALQVTWYGNMQIRGTLTQGSDRRLKEHISYLGDDAVEFVRHLQPAHYIKDDAHHVGFYAQDVEEIDIWNCMIGEMNGYKTLGYTELIAPLVAYCQKLEERINELERQIGS